MNLFKNTIINFHSITSKAWMEKVFILLKNRYRLISVRELESYYYEGKRLDNTCSITYDDGHESFHSIVFPLLKKYEIPASLYVSPLMIKERKNFWFQEIENYDDNILYESIDDLFKSNDFKNNISIGEIFKSMKLNDIWDAIYRYMDHTGVEPKKCVNLDSEQLIEIKNSGLVTIGAHTLNHPILSNEDDKIALNEIKESIDQLSDLINTKIKYFAYPNGIPNVDFGYREVKVLKDLGIKLSFSTENKAFSMEDDPLNIPRNGLTKGGKMFILSKLILGKRWDKIKGLLKNNSFRV